jgi:hypothetical protein
MTLKYKENIDIDIIQNKDENNIIWCKLWMDLIEK